MVLMLFILFSFIWGYLLSRWRGTAVFKAEGEGKGSPSTAPLLSITPCLPCSVFLNTSILRGLWLSWMSTCHGSRNPGAQIPSTYLMPPIIIMLGRQTSRIPRKSWLASIVTDKLWVQSRASSSMSKVEAKKGRLQMSVGLWLLCIHSWVPACTCLHTHELVHTPQPIPKVQSKTKTKQWNFLIP